MPLLEFRRVLLDRKSTRLNSSHTIISYAVFCLNKKIFSFPLRQPQPPCNATPAPPSHTRRRPDPPEPPPPRPRRPPRAASAGRNFFFFSEAGPPRLPPFSPPRPLPP